MSLRALLRFQNPDSTQDMNDRSRDLFNKGIFFGGDVAPVTGLLQVRVSPFASVGADGMFVREDMDSTILAVQAGVRNYIIIRQRYVEDGEPITSLESLPELDFTGSDEEVVFAVVDVPAGATAVTTSMIEFFERDVVDPLGRLSFRGRLTTVAGMDGLPLASANVNRPGDFYIVTAGTGGFPELWAWNGESWVNITQAQTLISLLDNHRDNLDANSIHLTNLQAEAALGTVGAPSDSNRYVTQLDPVLPNQNENNALQGDLSALSGDPSGSSIPPSDSNRYVTASKIFATPAGIDGVSFVPAGGPNPGFVVELLNEGSLFVGQGGLGTATSYFNMYADLGGQNDQELLNTEFQPVRVTGVFVEASASTELNPATHPNVDALGFYNTDVQGLYILVNLAPDNPYTVGVGRRTRMGDILPEALILRGPQNGQVDARVVQLLTGNVNAQFDDSIWDGAVSPGDLVFFNGSSGQFELSAIGNSPSPLGIRGNGNNLVQEGLYQFPAPTAFSSGDTVYADPAGGGALTTTANDHFVGTFLNDQNLLVNTNGFGIQVSVGSLVQGITFPGSFFDAGLLPGEVAHFDGGSGEFVQFDGTNPAHFPVGIRGNSNNLIQEGTFSPTAGAPFLAGVRYYADEASPGQLTTVANDKYVAVGITTTEILVNSNHSDIWEDARDTFEVEHFTPSGLHRTGSGRTFLGADGGQIAASGSNSETTGAIFYATDTGVVFYCTNGATNTWVEIEKMNGPIEIVNDLTIQSSLVMPSPSISTFDDDAGDTMNPFAHAARHVATGEDPVIGVISQVSTDDEVMVPSPPADPMDEVLPTELTPTDTWFEALRVEFDFSGRGNNNQIAAWAYIVYGNLSDEPVFEVEFRLDVGTPGTQAERALTGGEGVTVTSSLATSQTFGAAALSCKVAGLNADAHNLVVRTRLISALPDRIEMQNRHLMLFDLGAA